MTIIKLGDDGADLLFDDDNNPRATDFGNAVQMWARCQNREHTTTIWQPWASLIAIGAKPYETRAYPPPRKLIGQRIAIHAAVRDPSPLLDDMDHSVVEAIADALEAGGLGHRVCWASLQRGAVVATAVLAGAYKCAWTQFHLSSGTPLTTPQVHISEHRGPYIGATLNLDPFGDYSPGRWAWHLTDISRFRVPVLAKGKQGWWTWDGSPCGEPIHCIDCAAYGRPDCCAIQENPHA